MTDPFSAAPEPTKRGNRPHSDVERDRWDRPLLPAIPADLTGPTDPTTKAPHTSVSTLADILVDFYAVNRWKQGKVALGLAARDDLYSLVCSVDPDDPNQMKDLYRYTDDAMEAGGSVVGRNYGTAIHTFTGRINEGKEPGNVPKSIREDVEAFRTGLAENEFEPMPDMSERMIAIPEVNGYKVAGTADCVYRCPHWPLPRIVDTKSAQKGLNAAMHNAIQLALYSRGAALWNPKTKRYEPMPKVDQQVGMVIGVPATTGRFEPWDIDLERGWALAQVAVHIHRERKYKGFMTPYQRPDVVLAGMSWADQVAAATSRQDLSRIRSAALEVNEYVPELHKLAMAKLQKIKENEAVRGLTSS